MTLSRPTHPESQAPCQVSAELLGLLGITVPAATPQPPQPMAQQQPGTELPGESALLQDLLDDLDWLCTLPGINLSHIDQLLSGAAAEVPGCQSTSVAMAAAQTVAPNATLATLSIPPAQPQPQPQPAAVPAPAASAFNGAFLSPTATAAAPACLAPSVATAPHLPDHAALLSAPPLLAPAQPAAGAPYPTPTWPAAASTSTLHPEFVNPHWLQLLGQLPVGPPPSAHTAAAGAGTTSTVLPAAGGSWQMPALPLGQTPTAAAAVAAGHPAAHLTPPLAGLIPPLPPSDISQVAPTAASGAGISQESSQAAATGAPSVSADQLHPNRGGQGITGQLPSRRRTGSSANSDAGGSDSASQQPQAQQPQPQQQQAPEEEGMAGMTGPQRYHYKRKLNMQRLEQELADKVAQLTLLQQENQALRSREHVLETLVGNIDKKLESMAASCATSSTEQWLTLLLSGISGAKQRAHPLHAMLEVSNQVDVSSLTLEECVAVWGRYVARLRPLLQQVDDARAAYLTGQGQQQQQQGAAAQAEHLPPRQKRAAAAAAVQRIAQVTQRHAGQRAAVADAAPAAAAAAAQAEECGAGGGGAVRPLECYSSNHEPLGVVDGRVVYGGPGTEGVPLPLLAQVEQLVIENIGWILALMCSDNLVRFQFLSADMEGKGRLPPIDGDPFWDGVLAAVQLTPGQLHAAALCLQVAGTCREHVLQERQQLQTVLDQSPALMQQQQAAAAPAGGAAAGRGCAAATGGGRGRGRAAATDAAGGGAGSSGSRSGADGSSSSGHDCLLGEMERLDSQLAALEAIKRNMVREELVRHMPGWFACNLMSLLSHARYGVAAWPWAGSPWALYDAARRHLAAQQQQQHSKGRQPQLQPGQQKGRGQR